MQLNVHRYYLPESLQNFNHLVWSTTTREAAVVDPFNWQAALDEAAALDVAISEIWLTHGHGDHVAGVPTEFDGPIRGHPDITRCNITHPYKAPTVFDFAGARIEVLVTPGHIMDHLCFFLPDTPALLAGDTLFNAGVGNTRSGDVHTLYQSIQQLRALPAQTALYNGHDYFLTNLKFTESVVGATDKTQHWIEKCESSTPATRPISTLGDEATYNLFLRTDDESLQSLLRQQGHKVDSAESAFIALRSLRDQW
ncbi:MAG: hypothetical protein JXQ97_13470 [Natronospirillum sp.]